MNKPYVKQYNEHGLLMNPIDGKYSSTGPNRSQRKVRKSRNFNNSANCQMTVLKTQAYRKRIQLIDGKPIVHYDLKTK